MTEKTPKEITEAKDKIASAKSIEIRCASAATRSPVDRNIVLARSSSTTSLEKTRRTNSAPPQRRNAASGTRVQVNIVIDAPGLAEDKSAICGKMQDEKDAVEKLEEASTKVGRIARIFLKVLKSVFKNLGDLFITLRITYNQEDINYTNYIRYKNYVNIYKRKG